MDLRIRGLPYEPFAPLFEMSARELSEHGTVRRVATSDSAFPCRVTLRKAAPGETVVLTNYAHLAAPASPYRSVGPIFVRRDAGPVFDRVNAVPELFRARPLSLRAYDRENMMVAADVTTGDELLSAAARLLAREDVALLHVHHAAFGCYHCRIERA